MSLYSVVPSLFVYLELNRLGLDCDWDRQTDRQTISWQMPRFTMLRG